jgi:error-prone DNA polymerase
MASLPDYTELLALSNFSFLQGASHPEELLQRALALGYRGLALTDEVSVAGVVRAHLALREARQAGVPGAEAFQLLIGSTFTLAEAHACRLVVLACNRAGYGQLCRFITALRRATEGKGVAPLHREVMAVQALSDCVVLLVPAPHAPTEVVQDQAAWLQSHFAGRAWLGVALHQQLHDGLWLRQLRRVSQTVGLPLVAVGDVCMHVRSRKPLHDVLTAIHLNQPVADCGWALMHHAERHLRSRLRLTQRYPADLLAATQEVARRCTFSLDELRYEYPQEVVPEGHSPASWLRSLTESGLRERYGTRVPTGVRQQVEHELQLITELGYEPYFLTVHDIVHFARSRGILCQGRGSAANSAVCYALRITEVNPEDSTLLFERFISKERNEPPDIDVDFEHARREEVIQYLYRKYGRDRAALTATVIRYLSRSALRDVGKALALDADAVDRAAHNLHWAEGVDLLVQRLAEVGFDPADPRVQQWLELSRTLIGFPRHLSQHTGGFVIARGALSELVPIENATMAERSVIQWDKDDLDALGLLKVDVLALGMLTALRKSMDFIAQWRGLPAFELQDIPRGDEATYDMVCQADTIGVFQIESRAQMSMLPRLQPRCFYDLVVEVALVRPGPIQGGMVHPYLKAREQERVAPGSIVYPKGLEAALKRTLGVPIFQEQVMQVAVLAAGFSPGEADALRRSMAAWRRKGGVHKFYDRVIQGMLSNGYEREFAERIFKQIEGFGEYGFPESHAASFALLVYASAWVKCHEPAAFLAGLLNAQPLGFYSPSQLIQDARRHGVVVWPPDVCHSDWDCTLVPSGAAQPAVRLGLRLVAHLPRASAERIVSVRQRAAFTDVDELARLASLDQADLRALAAADALQSLAGHRRQQVWEAAALHRAPPLLRDAPVDEAPLLLPAAPEGEEIVFDYAALGLTLRRHPLALLRPRLSDERLMSAAQLADYRDGQLARACGIVTVRQQPGTASGVVFVTLEDETGTVNVIVWPHLKQRQRQELMHARLMAVYGVWQRQGEVRHLVAHRLRDLTPLLGRLATHSRDFH